MKKGGAYAPPFLYSAVVQTSLHLVALLAVGCNCKGVLAVAGTTGSTLLHISHGCLFDTGLKGEELGVAVCTFVHAEVELVAELHVTSLVFEGNLLRIHPFVAVTTVTGNGEGHLAVVTGTAGSTLLHLGHGDVLLAAGNDLPVVAVAALLAGVGEVGIMAEDSFRRPLGAELDVTHATIVTSFAVFLVSNSEDLGTVVAGTARFSLFHFGHGDMLLLGQVEH